jgi:hypothetical protein
MSYEIINKLKGASKITVIDGTATINIGDLAATAVIKGNVTANVENVVSVIFTSLKWSLPQGGVCKITRDAGGGPNVVANLAYGDFWQHDDLAISNTPTGNIVIAITGGGMCILNARKEAYYNVQTQDL